MKQTQLSTSTSLATVLVCSAFLVVLGQLLLPRLEEAQQMPVIAVAGGGLLSFAGALLARRWSWLRTRVAGVARISAEYFSISTWQLVFLIFALPFAWLARLAAGNMPMAHHAGVSIAAWLIACGLAIIGSWRFGERRYAIPRWEIGLMALLFAVAFALRGFGTGVIPTTLSGDESSAAFSSLAFLEGEFSNWFTIGWFSFPSLFYRVNSIGLWLFGRSIEGVRLLGTLAGAATVVGVYGLGRVVFGRMTGLIAAILLIGQHFHIHFSRIGLQNVWDGLFAMLALSGLWIGWKMQRRSGFILCGIALGLGQYFYVTFRAMPLIVLLWVLLVAIPQRDRFRQLFPSLLLSAWVALILFLPLALYFVDQPREFNAPLQRVTVLEGWLTEKALEAETSEATILLQQMWISAKGLTHQPLEHWYNVGQPLLLPIAAAIFLLGMNWLLVMFDSRSLLVLLPILMVVVAGGLSRDAPASQRYVMVTPLVMLVAAIPLSQVPQLIDLKWLRRLLFVVAIVIATFVTTTSGRFYFEDVFDDYVLGGVNTETAMQLAAYFADKPAQSIAFAGWPQMNYGSIATVPLLTPQVTAVDLMDPLVAPPDSGTPFMTYIFLPARVDELQLVQATYPNGRVVEVMRERDGLLYFVAYELGK